MDADVIFLCIQGGTWGYASPTKYPTMQSFPAGIHEADEETQDFIRRAGISPQRTLVQADSPPVWTSPPQGEPLRALRGWLPSLVLPRGASILLAHPDVSDTAIRVQDETPPDPQQPPGAMPLTFPCPAHACGRRFPSAAIAALHAEVDHPTAQPPQPPPQPEPSLTEA